MEYLDISTGPTPGVEAYGIDLRNEILSSIYVGGWKLNKVGNQHGRGTLPRIFRDMSFGKGYIVYYLYEVDLNQANNLLSIIGPDNIPSDIAQVLIYRPSIITSNYAYFTAEEIGYQSRVIDRTRSDARSAIVHKLIRNGQINHGEILNSNLLAVLPEQKPVPYNRSFARLEALHSKNPTHRELVHGRTKLEKGQINLGDLQQLGAAILTNINDELRSDNHFFDPSLILPVDPAIYMDNGFSLNSLAKIAASEYKGLSSLTAFYELYALILPLLDTNVYLRSEQLHIDKAKAISSYHHMMVLLADFLDLFKYEVLINYIERTLQTYYSAETASRFQMLRVGLADREANPKSTYKNAINFLEENNLYLILRAIDEALDICTAYRSDFEKYLAVPR